MTRILLRLRQAGLVLPTLLAIPALAVLIGLGSWQMQRKAWKDALLSTIAERVKAEPVDLERAVIAAASPGGPKAEAAGIHPAEYVRVRVRGRLLHEQERYLYAPDPRLGPGFNVYTPLHLADGRQIYVNRGFVPEALKEPARRAAGQAAGEVEIIGLIRGPGEKGAFTPANNPAANFWFWRDIAVMFGCEDGRPGTACATPQAQAKRDAQVHRVSIDAQALPANPGGWPRGGATNLAIPNRHLEYALTWYGLALTLVGVFGAFARSRLRSKS